MTLEEIKLQFRNGMIPDEDAFGKLIDEAGRKADLTNYPTKTDLTEYAKKTEIPAPQDLSHLATKSEIPDVSSFITLEEIPPTDLSLYAKISDIPSLDGLLFESDAEELYVRKDNISNLISEYIKINNFEKNHNLFDGEYQVGIIINNPPNLRLQYEFTGTDPRTAVVPVEPNTEYSIDIEPSKNNILRIGGDSRNIKIDSSTYTNLETFYYNSSVNQNVHTIDITTDEVTKFLYIYVSNNSGEPFMVVKKKNIKYEVEQSVVRDPKFNFSGSFDRLYEHKNIESLVENIDVMDSDRINQMFKDLVEENKDIGISTLHGSDDSGKDFYSFESKPASYNDAPYSSQTTPDSGSPISIPKIVLTGGIHGNEKSPPVSLYYFLKTLWENPDDDPTIDSLAQNVHFIIMPVIGAEGYNAHTYNNGTQNLNRDFPLHGGATKKSTQMAKQILDSNSDLDFFVDFHNMYGRDGMLGYVLTNSPLFKRIGTNIYKDIGTRWSKKGSSIPKDRQHKFAVATVANNGTIGRYVQDVIRKPAGLVEIPRKNPFNLDEPEYGENIIRLGVDIIFNIIYSAIRSK